MKFMHFSRENVLVRSGTVYASIIDMKRYVINITLFLALLGFCSTGKAATQAAHSSDWTLSMLRGSWEYHTFEDKWTLVFESDHNLVIDKNVARYTLLGESIRVISGNDTTDYQYALDGSKLTLRMPDGSERTYKKAGDGNAEQAVAGVLYATIDSTGRKARISFDGSHTFSLADEIGDGIGMYRVEGSTIILALNDTTTYTTQIRSWNADGSLDELSFDGRLYASEKPVAAAVPVQTTIVYVPYPDPDPLPGPPPGPTGPSNPVIPTPPPAPQIPAASIPTRSDNSSTSAPVRTFGSRRPMGN
jgi:hypothetical protein